jgi:6-pyruvoyltetrahydropterin/6-carboxytetrahydropterin synthase
MFELEKSFRFEAAHLLAHHDGKCRGLHGHSYMLNIILRSPKLVASGPKTNMLVDFDEVSSVVKPLLEQYLDHHYLNDTLGSDSTTVEFISKWIYDYLEPLLPCLHAVSLYETHSSKVTYTKHAG